MEFNSGFKGLNRPENTETPYF